MLFVIEGYPGSGKTYLGGQIALRGISNIHIIDVDTYTQPLLNSEEYRDCNDFYDNMIQKVRKAIASDIAKIPASHTIVLGGVISMLYGDADGDCIYSVAACKQKTCKQDAHVVERIWLDITPLDSGKNAELHESIKRAVLRELALPSCEWAHDPNSDDPWERMKPPAAPLTSAEFNDLFGMNVADFKKESVAYNKYFKAMAESFRMDNISPAQKTRAIKNGFVAMHADDILDKYFPMPTTCKKPKKRRRSQS